MSLDRKKAEAAEALAQLVLDLDADYQGEPLEMPEHVWRELVRLAKLAKGEL